MVTLRLLLLLLCVYSLFSLPLHESRYLTWVILELVIYLLLFYATVLRLIDLIKTINIYGIMLLIDLRFLLLSFLFFLLFLI